MTFLRREKNIRGLLALNVSQQFNYLKSNLTPKPRFSAENRG